MTEPYASDDRAAEAPYPLVIQVDDDPLKARWTSVRPAYYGHAVDTVTVVPNPTFEQAGATQAFRVTLEGSATFTPSDDGKTVKHDVFQICIYRQPEDTICQPETTRAVDFGERSPDGKSVEVRFTTPTDAAWGRWVYRLFLNAGGPEDVVPLAFTFASDAQRAKIGGEFLLRDLHEVGSDPARRSGEQADEQADETPLVVDTHVLSSKIVVTDSGHVEFPSIFEPPSTPTGFLLQPLYWIKEYRRILELDFDLETPGVSFATGRYDENPCNRGARFFPPLELAWYGVSDPKSGCSGTRPSPPIDFLNSRAARSADLDDERAANLTIITLREPVEPRHNASIATFYFGLRPTDESEARVFDSKPIVLGDPMIITDLPQDPH